MQKVILCSFGLVIASFGVWFLTRPGDWLEEFRSDDDVAREEVPAKIVRRIRAVGIGFIAIGLLWAYSVLFVAPAPDAVLF